MAAMFPTQISSSQINRLALISGDEPSTQMAALAKEVLNFIETSRPGLKFDITETPSGKITQADSHQSLSPATLEACLESDAVVVCGVREELVRGTLDSLEEGGAFANVQPFFLPSIGLLSTGSPRNGVQGLDITFVSDATKTGNEASREAIERLARWAGAYALRFSPPKPVHYIESFPLWNSVFTEVFSKQFPRVALHPVPMHTAATVLDSHPTRLNGIVLTTGPDGDVVSESAGNLIQGSQNLLAAATIVELSNQSYRKMPVILSLGKTSANAAVSDPVPILLVISLMLDLSFGLTAEAAAVRRSIRRTLDPIELIGSNIRTPSTGGTASLEEFMSKFMTHLDYYLEAASSHVGSQEVLIASPSPRPMQQRRPMGIIEKILTHAAVGLSKPEVQSGEIICVKVDWTLTSEILWAGMDKTYEQMGRPRLHRNDRMWLAIDHTVDPRTNHRPRQRGLIEKAESFQREAKLVNFLPANTSILHTDFTRDRALPGQIIVGCDSHSCSAGCVGGLAVGLGAADVVMPMVTGETWFRVPEICRINFTGQLPFGVGGKDVILHILGLFKRNTIAFQRAVEYGGPSLKELSMDARFAIANMTTEFGGMGACFEADESTAEWISNRSHLEHQGGLYFRADSGAQYAEVRTVNLSEVETTIALYPEPDNVVAVSEKVGTKLDGCFIGACTTTEEDLIVGGLVLEAGLRAGMVPSDGQRRVTPGSLSIIKNLERHGILDIYRQAGFDIGAPGCSYCVGINDVDVAGEGEIWLSSQNRNFRNRMGKGAIGSITCAAVVAASSFNMVVTDPQILLGQIDRAKLAKILGREGVSLSISPEISEPNPLLASNIASIDASSSLPIQASAPTLDVARISSDGVIRSKVQRFGENVDTDAIIPAEFVPGIDNAELGSHCFEYDRPEFRKRATEGSTIIVANRGFGSGSSREDAVRALQGAGIEAVIAPSFAFIYDRNRLNMGLFNITLPDPEFYTLANEGSAVVIDRQSRTVQIDGTDQVFYYQQSEIEKTLVEAGGVLPLYNRFGASVFRKIASANTGQAMGKSTGKSAPMSNRTLDW
ncbi:Aconitase/3-isopropylmalate dehydratase large subunit alpha/beta/alpha subdomain 1/3 [Penicillium robsamsonii]|uniref:Aconitase/3-isopropylmalate dehydratase large subunit alpha/beta/alpha subdomain 1/3 n=1 Tax=Penicillium robsamsonii TaxID=1792511 RepID=UPI0025479209|nr:Aconitase/3-isopropylmalate dehydratase large subunit alpha/beta/alpha subdomain 1/3 [Penicillium robsamsonii]KAJ5817867.1 Aconitase/3-isopropylmalate dehydratase large subunit alpha/beta/alpha subdomain 1/3 [Penicillium robsamsonii]